MGACRYRRQVLPAGTTADRISELFGAIGVTNRKAPALLQGLLQLIFSEFANIYTRIFISPA
jgi:hypothetical protein